MKMSNNNVMQYNFTVMYCVQGIIRFITTNQPMEVSHSHQKGGGFLITWHSRMSTCWRQCLPTVAPCTCFQAMRGPWPTKRPTPRPKLHHPQVCDRVESLSSLYCILTMNCVCVLFVSAFLLRKTPHISSLTGPSPLIVYSMLVATSIPLPRHRHPSYLVT